MIAQLRGKIVEAALEKDVFRLVIDVQGVGYEVQCTRNSMTRVDEGQHTTLYVSESVTAFDGATTLYGFLSKEEKDFFMRLRENVDGMGPKKALESMDKITKSMPDFKRAILEGDGRLLVSVFGFTKKTAEKLIFSLKDKLDSWAVVGAPKFSEEPKGSEEAMALSGLLNLGVREEEARELILSVQKAQGKTASADQILQSALKMMGAKMS